MMLTREDFKPVTLENKHILERYFREFPKYHSESSIITILTWENFAPCTFAEYKNHLILECCMDGERSIQTPIGEPDAELYDEVLQFARNENTSFEIYDEESCEIIQELHPNLPVTENRGYFEYVYRTEDLAKLKGKNYRNIRGQINTFSARWDYHVERISENNIKEIRELVCEWSAAKNCDENTLMREEVSAVYFCLDHWNDLPVDGIAIRIDEDEKLGSFAVWEIQNASQALIHFEKGLPQYPGIYKIINRETAKELLGKVEWINRESDMDSPGIREAKLRYHPAKFVKAYSVLPEDLAKYLK